MPTSDEPTITARLIAVRSPMHASLSPDGTHLLLTTCEVPLGGTDEVLRATVIDVTTGDERLVPAMGAGEHSAVWTPDGVGLAWCTTLADGTAAIAVADSLDGVPRTLHGSHRATGAPAWSPDGTTIAVAARRGTVIDRTRPYRWTRPIAAFDGTGPLEDPPQILLLDVATGEGRWLTDDGWRWSTPIWSPDGSRLAASTSIDPASRDRRRPTTATTIDAEYPSAATNGIPANCRPRIATTTVPPATTTA